MQADQPSLDSTSASDRNNMVQQRQNKMNNGKLSLSSERRLSAPPRGPSHSPENWESAESDHSFDPKSVFTTPPRKCGSHAGSAYSMQSPLSSPEEHRSKSESRTSGNIMLTESTVTTQVTTNAGNYASNGSTYSLSSGVSRMVSAPAGHTSASGRPSEEFSREDGSVVSSVGRESTGVRDKVAALESRITIGERERWKRDKKKLEDDTAKLRTDYLNQEAEAERLSQELQTVTADKDAAVQKVATLQGANEALTERVEALSESIETTQQQLVDVRQQLGASTTSEQVAKRQFESSQQLSDTLTVQVEKLQEDLATSRAEYTQLTSERETLKTELNAVREQESALRARYQQLQEEASAAETRSSDDLAAMRKQAEDAADFGKHKQAECSKTRDELKAAQEGIRRLEERLEKEHELTKAAESKASQAVEELASSRSNVEEEMANTSARLERTQQLLEKEQGKLKEAHEEIAAAVREKEEFEAENARLQGEAEVQAEHESQLRETVTSLQNKLDQTVEELDAVKVERADLEENCERARGAREKAEACNAKEMARVDEMSAKLQAAEAAQQAAETLNQQNIDEIVDLKANQENLKDDLDLTKELLEDAQKSRESSKAEVELITEKMNTQLAEQKDRYSQEIDEVRTQYKDEKDKFMSAITELEQEAQDLKSEREELKSKLANTKSNTSNIEKRQLSKLSSLEKKIEEQEAAHQRRIEQLHEAHKLRLDHEKQAIESRIADQTRFAADEAEASKKRQSETHSHELKMLEQKHETKLAEMATQHQENLQKVREELADEINSAKQAAADAHFESQEKLRHHIEEVDNARNQNHLVEASLRADIDALQSRLNLEKQSAEEKIHSLEEEVYRAKSAEEAAVDSHSRNLEQAGKWREILEAEETRTNAALAEVARERARAEDAKREVKTVRLAIDKANDDCISAQKNMKVAIEREKIATDESEKLRQELAEFHSATASVGMRPEQIAYARRDVTEAQNARGRAEAELKHVREEAQRALQAQHAAEQKLDELKRKKNEAEAEHKRHVHDLRDELDVVKSAHTEALRSANRSLGSVERELVDEECNTVELRQQLDLAMQMYKAARKRQETAVQTLEAAKFELEKEQDATLTCRSAYADCRKEFDINCLHHQIQILTLEQERADAKKRRQHVEALGNQISDLKEQLLSTQTSDGEAFVDLSSVDYHDIVKRLMSAIPSSDSWTGKKLVSQSDQKKISSHLNSSADKVLKSEQQISVSEQRCKGLENEVAKLAEDITECKQASAEAKEACKILEMEISTRRDEMAEGVLAGRQGNEVRLRQEVQKLEISLGEAREQMGSSPTNSPKKGQNNLKDDLTRKERELECVEDELHAVKTAGALNNRMSGVVAVIATGFAFWQGGNMTAKRSSDVQQSSSDDPVADPIVEPAQTIQTPPTSHAVPPQTIKTPQQDLDLPKQPTREEQVIIEEAAEYEDFVQQELAEPSQSTTPSLTPEQYAEQQHKAHEEAARQAAAFRAFQATQQPSAQPQAQQQQASITQQQAQAQAFAQAQQQAQQEAAFAEAQARQQQREQEQFQAAQSQYEREQQAFAQQQYEEQQRAAQAASSPKVTTPGQAASTMPYQSEQLMRQQHQVSQQQAELRRQAEQDAAARREPEAQYDAAKSEYVNKAVHLMAEKEGIQANPSYSAADHMQERERQKSVMSQYAMMQADALAEARKLAQHQQQTLGKRDVPAAENQNSNAGSAPTPKAKRVIEPNSRYPTGNSPPPGAGGFDAFAAAAEEAHTEQNEDAGSAAAAWFW